MITGGTVILGHLHLPIITYLPMCLPRLRSHPWMIFLPKGKAHDLVVKRRESHPPKKWLLPTSKKWLMCMDTINIPSYPLLIFIVCKYLLFYRVVNSG
jgi:hypothetical protein